MSTIVLSNELKLRKEVLIEKLLQFGINTRPFFNPLSSLMAFKNEKDSLRAKKENIISKELSEKGINLPSALCLEEEDIEFVCNCLLEIINQTIS